MIEDALEEELLHEFKGGTLTINPETKLNNDKLIKPDSPDNGDDNESTKANKNDNRWGANFISPLTAIPNKISASLWNKNSSSTTASRENTIQPAICITENPNNYFTFRESVLARALTECKEQFLDEEADGPLLEAFLLTQISHWNSDKERLLLLTPQTLVVAKYDFIALRRLGYKKLPLEFIEEIVYGELVYPNGSLIPNRNTKGVRLVWNKNKPYNFSSYWNPFNDDIPFCTFTYHPLFFHKDCVDEKLKNLYCLEAFVEKLSKAVADLPRNNEISKEPCVMEEKDIVLQTYVGIGSIIHNRNALGFFKVRGKFSF
ncbi:hypothetical protein Zmor_026463 [Zophobas morio]|uniref:HSac2 domain-containing protein n=1 Tax=Zophobas morio TaxID=2755281 RepID=A0AA38HUE1_9CUCU|nr:hypothetical protein Zmor_026463 [Zophobas morio]